MNKNLFFLLDDYLDYLKSLNYSPRTLYGLKYIIRGLLRYLRKFHGVEMPDELRKSHLHAWQKHLGTLTNHRGIPQKPHSLHGKISAARGFLARLAELGFILRGVPESLRSVKLPKTLPGSVAAHSEMRKILRKIDTSSPEGYRDRTILELMYSSGIRAGEVVGLNVGDLDLDNALLKVTGKGKKDRVVPVGRTALRHLETYVRAVRPFLLTGDEKDALFLNHFGRRILYGTLRERVHKYCDPFRKNATITPHTFRRSCATEMVRGGANLYHVKDMFGHESLDTMKHYVKLTINDLKKTHEKCHPREKDL